MTKKELADYYGSMAAAARALGRTRGAIQQWPEDLPARVQFEIEGRTKGMLKASAKLRKDHIA